MNSVTLGVLPTLSGPGGGIYQYSLSILHSLEELSTEGRIVIFTEDTAHPETAAVRRRGWRVLPIEAAADDGRALRILRRTYTRALGSSRVRRAVHRARGATAAVPASGDTLDEVQRRPDLRRRIRAQGVDLMLYPAPTSISFEAGVPYVMAVHDLQHRLQPEFPEVSAGSLWRRREHLFRNGVRYATTILVDSEIGKEDVLSIYGEFIDGERIAVLPFAPPPYLGQTVPEWAVRDLRKKHRLPERFLFYPAQFWSHKNHVRIVEALGLAERLHGVGAHAVFCGSSEGPLLAETFAETMATANREGVADRVHYLGYVSDREMAVLYSEAEALVMPTFFGPTNIPVLEAWSLGCPVLTSDIRGIREQVADAALLVDPRSSASIAEGIVRLWTDPQLQETLAAAGAARARAFTHSHFRRRLGEILLDATSRVRKGATPAPP